VLLPLAFADGESDVILRGGTHVPWSPVFEYIERIYLPALRSMGVQAEVELWRRGFYPKGGGALRLRVRARSAPLRPVNLTERGPLIEVRGVATACGLPGHVAERMAQAVGDRLQAAGLTAKIAARRTAGEGQGAYLFLEAHYAHARGGFSALGARGKPTQQVADEATAALLAFHASAAAVDRHLADQLLLPAALAAGTSRYCTEAVTAHLETNAHVIQQLLPVHCRIDGKPNAPGRVECVGAPPGATPP
jgi:RNA 3'-terminal phosphate cyclase (ATP)